MSNVNDLSFRFVRISSNSKTGPIPVTSTSMQSCAKACPFNQDDDGQSLTGQGKPPLCYGGYGHVRLHWTRLSAPGADGKNIHGFLGLLNAIAGLPRNQLWRHNEVGDLPSHDGHAIDGESVGQIVRVNRGKKGFTYTHMSPESGDNAVIVKDACNRGFTINLSANDVRQSARYVKEYGLPTVAVLPDDAPNVQHVDGVRVVACPAEKSDKVTCSNCGMCHDALRGYVIGFRAHGSGKKHAQVIAKG